MWLRDKLWGPQIWLLEDIRIVDWELHLPSRLAWTEEARLDGEWGWLLGDEMHAAR